MQIKKFVERIIKPVAPAKPAKKIITINELWEEYLSSSSALLTIGTVERKKSALKHLFKFFGDTQISEIDFVIIEKYLSFRKKEILNKDSNLGKREQEISFRTANIELAVLSSLLNFALRRGYLEKNPAAGIKKLNELSRLKTLSDSDIDKLIAGATNKLTRNIMTFLIYTGCRKGEALNLKWDDVDLQNEVIAIKDIFSRVYKANGFMRLKMKTKYNRYIPISGALKRVLEGINRESVYVFSYRGKKLSNFRESFKTACKRAGLNGLRVHDLRHIFASKMVMSGTSLYITGELLGHRTPQMTMRYAHLAPYTLKKAVDEVWG